MFVHREPSRAAAHALTLRVRLRVHVWRFRYGYVPKAANLSGDDDDDDGDGDLTDPGDVSTEEAVYTEEDEIGAAVLFCPDLSKHSC